MIAFCTCRSSNPPGGGVTFLLLAHPCLLLQGTQSGYKNELLFSQFGVNYNALPEQLRKVGGGGAAAAERLMQLGGNLMPNAECHISRTAAGVGCGAAASEALQGAGGRAGD